MKFLPLIHTFDYWWGLCQSYQNFDIPPGGRDTLKAQLFFAALLLLNYFEYETNTWANKCTSDVDYANGLQKSNTTT